MRLNLSEFGAIFKYYFRKIHFYLTKNTGKLGSGSFKLIYIFVLSLNSLR